MASSFMVLLLTELFNSTVFGTKSFRIFIAKSNARLRVFKQLAYLAESKSMFILLKLKWDIYCMEKNVVIDKSDVIRRELGYNHVNKNN